MEKQVEVENKKKAKVFKKKNVEGEEKIGGGRG